MIATFGDKVFSVSSNSILTFDGLSRGLGLEADAQEQDGQKPSTYIKGVSLETLKFTVALNSAMGIDVDGEIKSWETVLAAKIPYLFVLGDKPVIDNKFLLKTLNITDVVINGSGQKTKAKLDLDFEEYVRAGKKEEDKNTTSSGTGTGGNPKAVKPAAKKTYSGGQFSSISRYQFGSDEEYQDVMSCRENANADAAADGDIGYDEI